MEMSDDAECDVTVLEKALKYVNKTYFSKGAIKAELCWDLPKGVIHAKKTCQYDVDNAEEIDVACQMCLEAVRAGDLDQAKEAVVDYARAGSFKCAEIMMNIARKEHSELTEWAEIVNKYKKINYKTSAAGMYSKNGQYTIVLHPYIYHKQAPRYVINYLVYHEACHIVDNSPESNQHRESFLELERQFTSRDKAKEWLVKHLFETVHDDKPTVSNTEDIEREDEDL